MTAYARHSAALDIQHPNLTIVKGDVMNLAAVAQAVQGQEAVVCTLGSGQKLTGTVRSEGTRHIVQAMEESASSAKPHWVQEIAGAV